MAELTSGFTATGQWRKRLSNNPINIIFEAAVQGNVVEAVLEPGTGCETTTLAWVLTVGRSLCQSRIWIRLGNTYRWQSTTATTASLLYVWAQGASLRLMFANLVLMDEV